MASFQSRAIKYAVLPGILPRLGNLVFSGFVHISYLMALIYRAVRLLPANHPYLNAANRGRFGIRNVIAEAANNLKFTRNNIDQIAIFFVMLAGIVLIWMQIALFILAVVAQQPSLASGFGAIPPLPDNITWDVKTIFGQDSVLGHGRAGTASQDLAFIILDRVFGMKGIYNSCIAIEDASCLDFRGNPIPSEGTWPTTFHTALHSLLSFYSYGIFIVACLLIVYYIITITAEMAASGTPFGQRMNKAWTPVRLIVFFALLIPISTAPPSGSGNNDNYNFNPGINGAQYITFWVAKFGSNFATNGWAYFADTLLDTHDPAVYVATPKAKVELGELMQFLFVAKTCQILESKAADATTSYNSNIPSMHIEPYLVRSHQGINLRPGQSATDFPFKAEDYALSMFDAGFGLSLIDVARAFAGNGNITISFGFKKYNTKEQYEALDAESKKYPGGIIPICGQISIPLTTPSEAVKGVQAAYYQIVTDIFGDEFMVPYADCLARYSYNRDNESACAVNGDTTSFGSGFTGAHINLSEYGITSTSLAPNNEFVRAMITRHTSMLGMVNDAIRQAFIDDSFNMPEPENATPGNQAQGTVFGLQSYLLSKGWGGAGLWYNRIAELNGDVVDAVNGTPRVVQWPLVMEKVAERRSATDQSVAIQDRFNPLTASGEEVQYDRPNIDTYIAPALYQAYKIWDNSGVKLDPIVPQSGNIFTDFINLIFGTGGVFDMYANVNVHPLAQLSSLGKSMMYASMRNIGGGMLLEGASAAFATDLGKGMGLAVGDFMLTMGISVLALSFVLYYVLPFLPFIYFMFAVSGWVKSIFEAIVAMPLWAMSHIRIDGDGLPGDAAENGYFLLFEIFLRPILTVIGLVASISIFSAMVRGLNEIFDLLVINVAGFSMEGVKAGINKGEIGDINSIFDPQSDEQLKGFFKDMTGDDISKKKEGLIAELTNAARDPVDRLFYTVMYVIMTYMIGLSCFKLIDQVPNQILRFMGVSVSTIQDAAGNPEEELTSTTFTGTTMMTQKLSGGQIAALLGGK